MTLVSQCFTCTFAVLDYFDPLESSFVHLLNIHSFLAFVLHEWPCFLSHFFMLVFFLFLPLNGDSSLGLNLYTPPRKSLLPWLCADHFLEPDPHSYFFTETVPCFLPHFMKSSSCLSFKSQYRCYFLGKALEDS